MKKIPLPCPDDCFSFCSNCPYPLYQHFDNNFSGEPCADSLPASPEALPLCVSVSENKAGQGVN